MASVAVAGRVDVATVRPVTPADREAVIRLLGESSPDALHARFLTGLGGTPPAGLVDRLLARDPVSRSVLALVGADVVGHGMCADAGLRAGRPCVEVALLVRDDHQRRGVGAALLRALADEARAMAAASVQVTTGADNRVVTAMMASRAPGLRPQCDGTTLTYLVPVHPTQVRAVGRASIRSAGIARPHASHVP